MEKHESVYYTCSVCGTEYKYLEGVRACEADHIGLTPDEVDAWIMLLDRGDRKRIAEFERKHGIDEDTEIPENWEFIDNDK